MEKTSKDLSRGADRLGELVPVFWEAAAHFRVAEKHGADVCGDGPEELLRARRALVQAVRCLDHMDSALRDLTERWVNDSGKGAANEKAMW